MMGIHRSALKSRRRSDAATQKLVNRIAKTKERARRDARMMTKIKTGSLPYTPPVMSWLSRKLEKASTRITDQDVQSLLR